MRVIPSILVAVALSGCAANPPIGNELGGTIAWSRANETVYFQQATEHCAKYGKAAKINDVKDHHGGAIIFECR